MNKLLARVVLFACILSIIGGCDTDSTVITTGSLFEEMIDLAALAEYPDPAYRMKQFSSYDHRSRIPGGPDWFANSDGFGGEPTPNFEEVLREPDSSGIGEYLMVDVPGPGAVVRMWTASISGEVRCYIDNMKTPLYEGEADRFFRRPYEVFPEAASLAVGPFGETVYQRDASYAPIAFAKRLRLVWIGNISEIHFYQIQVRLYEKKARVASFSPEDIKKYRDTIERVTAALADPETHLPTFAQNEKISFSCTLAAGEKINVAELDGPAALTRLTLRLKAEEVDKALRRTVLQIVCDGYPWGQVCSPAGDFFGAAPGINPYRSLPFTVEADGEMICRYVMPFRKNMRIELENRGGGEVAISGEAVTSDYAWNDRSMHFRARWRADHNIIASNREVQDIPFLLANGKGVYVGTTSLLLNPSSVPTPWGNWWGEGDEKVFVDADTLPSLFGTGSEDYYNYSWSSPDIFYFPYCGQPRNDGPGNRGFVSNYRWHILDPIPFRENIAFYMELFSHERTPGFSYARIGYCYARPGLRDDFRPISTEDLRELAPPGQWHPEPRFGARNSEFYPAEKVVRNRSATRTRRERLGADGAVLVWSPKRRGERKTFALPVKESGVKKIFITALLSPRSGAFKVYLDGRELTERDGSIDLYRPHRTLLRNFGFPQTELRKGAHILTLEYVGAGRNLTSPEIGIDFFWIQSLQ